MLHHQILFYRRKIKQAYLTNLRKYNAKIRFFSNILFKSIWKGPIDKKVSIIKYICAKLWLYFYFKKPTYYFNRSISRKKESSLYARMVLPSFNGSGEGRFFLKKINKVLSLIFYHLTFKRDLTLLLKGHESLTQ